MLYHNYKHRNSCSKVKGDDIPDNNNDSIKLINNSKLISTH